MDELESETKRFATAWSQTLGVKVQELHERMSYVVYAYYQAVTPVPVEEFGKKHRRDIIKSSPSDLATLCYTSVSSVQPGVTHTSAEVNR